MYAHYASCETACVIMRVSFACVGGVSDGVGVRRQAHSSPVLRSKIAQEERLLFWSEGDYSGLGQVAIQPVFQRIAPSVGMT